MSSFLASFFLFLLSSPRDNLSRLSPKPDIQPFVEQIQRSATLDVQGKCSSSQERLPINWMNSDLLVEKCGSYDLASTIPQSGPLSLHFEEAT